MRTGVASLGGGPLLALVLCTGYAVARYHVFQGVEWEHFFLYVLNKGVSFAGLVLLVLSRCSGDPVRRRRWGVSGFALILLHIPLSLMILQPAYFPKFYKPDGRMNWQAEASMLAGGVALMILLRLQAASDRAGSVASANGLLPGAGRLMLFLAAAHVAVMGYAGWWSVGAWPGYLPPITLLSFVAAAIGLCWRRPMSPPLDCPS